MKELVTYKFYNDKKQRLSLFGREKDGKLEIFKWACSKKDTFSKDLSKIVYYDFIKGIISGQRSIHPEIITLDIENRNLRKTFFNYCYNNFYKHVMVTIEYNENALTKGGTIYVKGSKIKSFKQKINGDSLEN